MQDRINWQPHHGNAPGFEQKPFAGHQFHGVAVEPIDTGGGCKGLYVQLASGAHALITACASESEYPRAADPFVDVGFYRADGTQCCSIAQVPTFALCGLIVGFQFGA